jgi:hypothetical protein
MNASFFRLQFSFGFQNLNRSFICESCMRAVGRRGVLLAKTRTRLISEAPLHSLSSSRSCLSANKKLTIVIVL